MLTKKLRFSLFFLSSIFYFFSTISQNNPVITHTITEQSPTERSVTIAVDPKGSLLYADSLHFSVDHPDIALSWQANTEAINQYDPTYRATKKIYGNPVEFTVETETSSTIKPIDTHLHMTYEIKGFNPTEFLVPLHFNAPLSYNEEKKKSAQSKNPQSPASTSVRQNDKPFSLANYTSLLNNWSTHLSNALKTTNSLPIQLLLVFILGILLSLTPCIYPMIPITVGILQAQGGRSFWYNCILALSYTCGLATTFALFGLAASCVGPLCGKLLMHPIFVLFIVALLMYLAFSLFDWYELYTPKFMTPSSSTNPNGSLLSTFLFGAASGTFASPCVSPGLALLLTIVAGMGNIFMGFLLLFVFGVGLSMPLLIVGTISGSLSVMPKAGSWMVEIKKLFGFLLLSMCFYYLKNILPWHVLLWMLCIFIFSAGIYYLKSAVKAPTSGLKKLYNFLGFILISWAVVLAAQSAQETVYGRFKQEESFWCTNYQEARALALKDKKPLFIDFWATYCSICIAINNKTLKEPAVVAALNTTVPLKVDGSYDTNEPYAALKEKYSIKGFPTFLLVDPETETIIRQWGSELYTKPIDEFIKELA